MYKTILVPVEPSHGQQLEGALAVAKTLAEGGGAEIHAVTVVEPVPGHFSMAKSLPDLRIKAGERAQMKLQEILGEGSGIKARVLHGNAATEILGFAAREGVDCIVIASHRPGFADYFLGSTAARVVRHAQCSVHVIR